METGEGGLQPCHYLTTCWAHQSAAPPRLPVKVDGRDTEALLDSGSAITLIRPEYAGRSGGEAVMVSCVHGDTHRYPTTEVRLQTPRGQCQVRAGVVRGLPVPVLLERDCALFQSYWKGGPPLPEEPRPRRARGNRGSPLPVCIATPESETEWPCTEPASRQREEDSETVTAPERVPEGTLLDFRPEQQEHSGAPTVFGTAQLQEPNFAQAWRSVAMIEGATQGGVSAPLAPYFAIKGGLLYCVCQVRGEEVHQLLVPRPYVTKVLYLAHTHLLGAHLGMEKTYKRVVARFYWPGVKKAVEEYCRHCATCQLHSPKVTYREALIPLTIIDVPFRRIGMDIVGPLIKVGPGPPVHAGHRRLRHPIARGRAATYGDGENHRKGTVPPVQSGRCGR